MCVHVSYRGQCRARDAHLLKLPCILRRRLRRELVRQSEVAHGALVEGVALIGGHAAVPEGAGHVDLLADLLHRLLDERQRVLRGRLLLLGGSLRLGAMCRCSCLLSRRASWG